MTAYRQRRDDGQFELRFGAGLDERCGTDISIDACIEGWNFLLDTVSRRLRPRLPMDLEGTAPNAGEVTGILQLVTSADVVTQLVVAADTWYKWDGASVFSDVTPPLFTSGGAGARMRASHWTLDDFIVVTDIDLENVLYKWDGSTVTRLKTGLSAGAPVAISSLTCSGSTATAIQSTHGYSTGDLVIVAGATETEYNGEFQIVVSDANTFTYTMVCSTTPATGSPTADLGVELQAKYSVNHNSRNWLFNIVADGTATESMILVSAFENAEDYDNSVRGSAQGGAGTASDAFFLLAPDGRPINGAVEFFDTLVISTANGKLFRLIGDDAETYNFKEYYPGSSAEGDEGIVNIGNDLVFFRHGKAIESLIATDRFGDVSTDDLSRWIPTSVKLLSNPISVYDSETQLVYFFDSGVDGVLVLDKEHLLLQLSDETGQWSPWSLFKTNLANNLVTKCAVQLRDPLSTTKDKTVFWGDASGNIYNMNGTLGGGDGGTESVSLRRRTRHVRSFNTRDELTIGRVEYVRRALTPIELVFNWADEYSRSIISFDLKASFAIGGALFWGGDYYWNETDNYWGAGSVADDQLSTLGFSVAGKGSGFYLEIQISDTDDYRIARIYV